jgi:sugar phosphate isomerase/epimerase
MTHPCRLGIQLTLPDAFETNEEFSALLSFVSLCGFTELELNIADPRRVPPWRLKTFLTEFGLEMTRLATGLAARTSGLSLSAARPRVRRRTVRRCLAMIGYAAEFPAEVIVGLLKGAADDDSEHAPARFADSLAEIAAAVGTCPVPVRIEATNRRECRVVNTLQEAIEAVEKHPGAGFSILPDTYHVRAEGPDVAARLLQYKDRFSSLHLSDDNRRLPGLGGIDFSSIVCALFDAGYRGSLVLEGRFGPSPRDDIGRSVRYLRHFMRY